MATPTTTSPAATSHGRLERQRALDLRSSGGGMGTWLAALLDRFWIITFGLFSVVLLSTIAVTANARPFWHDEIYTILHAQLPTIATMWTATRDGIDLAPPLNAMITHAVQMVAGSGPLAIRLPAFAGYWTMTLVVFHLVRRRSNTLAALSAALFPCFTAAYRYSYEARGYGVMLGLFALALFAWSEAAGGRRRAVHLPLLGIAIAAGLWNQYYAIFVLIPIGAGEVIRLARDRKPDWAIWVAIAAGGACALPLRPIMQLASGYSATYWSRATLSDVGVAYRFLFGSLLDTRFEVAAAIIVLLMFAGVLTRRGQPSQSNVNARLPLPAYEVAAGIACFIVPLCAVLAGVYVTGVFVPRYALTGVVGLSLVVPPAVWRARAPWHLAEWILCLTLAGSFGQSAYQAVLVSRPIFHDPVAQRPMLLQQLASPEPVVVTGGVLYLQFWYYTPSALRNQLIYLADPANADHYMGQDTIDRNFLALRRWAPVTIQDYEPFVAQHRQFRVYAAGAGWLVNKLKDSGATLNEIGRELGAPIYRVTLP